MQNTDDIRQDITDITGSVEDAYYVQSVTVRTDNGRGDEVDTVVDFGQSLVVTNADSVLGNILQLRPTS